MQFAYLAEKPRVSPFTGRTLESILRHAVSNPACNGTYCISIPPIRFFFGRYRPVREGIQITSKTFIAVVYYSRLYCLSAYVN